MPSPHAHTPPTITDFGAQLHKSSQKKANHVWCSHQNRVEAGGGQVRVHCRYAGVEARHLRHSGDPWRRRSGRERGHAICLWKLHGAALLQARLAACVPDLFSHHRRVYGVLQDPYRAHNVRYRLR
ncbi:RNA polymerase subunit, putative [Leishmania tarentolae]|uniref:RNA polymerase subunit, putative n=1 Tax=Leishmania tarentolae TaxID=5689 RepID=A0A640KET6_LEITA|nr:RNA polymerase subunit, putative [Leishmania tarentolae]